MLHGTQKAVCVRKQTPDPADPGCFSVYETVSALVAHDRAGEHLYYDGHEGLAWLTESDAGASWLRLATADEFFPDGLAGTCQAYLDDAAQDELFIVYESE